MKTTEISNLFKRKGIQISLKLMMIGMLVLLLLIPKFMILELISERKYYNESVIEEQTKTWGGKQILTGPILKIPYLTQEIETEIVKGKERKKKTEVKKFLCVNPKELNYEGEVIMDSKNRNLYKAEVYQADLAIQGHFELPEKEALKIDDLIKIDYENAFLVYGIADLKGMTIAPHMIFDGEKKEFEPGTQDIRFNLDYTKMNSGIHTDVHLEDQKTTYPFKMNLNLKGSQSLSFLPIAKQTHVNLKSDFPHPSFQGAFSNTNSVSPNGFNVDWNVSEFNRSLPNYWVDNSEIDLGNNEFGVKLITLVNHYTKSERTTKYMFLVIVLTFLAFFIIEIVNQLRIHVFQYTLVGIALAVFFTLLLAFSEYIGYDYSYLISAVATIILIVLYSLSIFNNKKSSMILLGSLLMIFSFIYTIIQMEQFSLLAGAIGVFITVAITMYTTRKIKWYESSQNA